MQDQRETIQSANVWLEGLCRDSPIHLSSFQKLLDTVFVISEIPKVEVSVIGRGRF